ncbi:unnamed protein product [Sphagnum troendelagicum]|uniref:Secreted protein n=1 Tax=Sphagnum troendelagicum TaxID=128251 RepID=A0ABP0U336_9BRYO
MMMMATRTASFLAFVALFFSLLFCCAPTTASTNTLGVSDRDLAKRKISCYQDIDNGLWGSHCRSSAINKENCALRCVSHSCYDSVYGNDHLEEGEVDMRRGRQFKVCIRGEWKAKRIAKARGYDQ